MEIHLNTKIGTDISFEEMKDRSDAVYIAAGTQVKKESVIILTVSRGGKRAVQTAAPTKAPVVTARPKTTKRSQKYDASLDGYLQ